MVDLSGSPHLPIRPFETQWLIAIEMTFSINSLHHSFARLVTIYMLGFMLTCFLIDQFVIQPFAGELSGPLRGVVPVRTYGRAFVALALTGWYHVVYGVSAL